MAEHRLPPTSSTTGANHVNSSSTPSTHPPGIFQEPSHRINDGSRRNQPTPHSHLPLQQYGAGPLQHAHPPQPQNLFHRPPQPMRNPPYGVTHAPPPRSLVYAPHHHATEYFVERYRRQAANVPLAGTHVRQSGVAPPSSQRPEPHHLPPHGSSTRLYPLPQGHATPPDRPHSGSSSQFPVAPSRRVSQGHGHQQASASHYALPLRQYHPQDQNDPPYVPPHMRPPQAAEPVKTKRKYKRKAPDSEEPALRKSKIRKVSPPQSQAGPPAKRRGPGRPTNAERDAKRALEKRKAANAPSDAQAFNPRPEVPGIWPIPFQIEIKPEPSTPAPRQTGIPGNPQASTTSPQPATSAEAPAADAREHERSDQSTDPLWATNLPSAFDDFINEHAPLNPNRNDCPSVWFDLDSYPPIDDPFWPSVNHLTLPSRETFDNFNVKEEVKDIVDSLVAEGFPWIEAP
ncbi:hypothetical protein ARMSODRAFT_968817 [Armillaria solidipes]|uniref:Uncharacterized protein n=1 Tax=Armillaria solidipes TaxID=1076256 RepID=A0A2H3CPT0_9AGAR|nr:hypothetical protein ARMSODRAFT_968817 [Armillaria solidipes]